MIFIWFLKVQKIGISDYKCQNFPLEWTLEEVLISDIDAADTMILRKDNRWWMMTNEDPLKLNNHNYQMNIYYSDNLLNEVDSS